MFAHLHFQPPAPQAPLNIAVPMVCPKDATPIAQYQLLASRSSGKTIAQSSLQKRKEPLWYKNTANTVAMDTSTDHSGFIGIARDANVFNTGRQFPVVATRGLMPVALPLPAAATEPVGICTLAASKKGPTLKSINATDRKKVVVGSVYCQSDHHEHTMVHLHPISADGVSLFEAMIRTENAISEHVLKKSPGPLPAYTAHLYQKHLKAEKSRLKALKLDEEIRKVVALGENNDRRPLTDGLTKEFFHAYYKSIQSMLSGSYYQPLPGTIKYLRKYGLPEEDPLESIGAAAEY